MKKLLSTVSSLIFLGTLTLSSQSVLAGIDDIAASLLDAAERSRPATRAIALQVVDEEVKPDIKKLVNTVIFTGKVQTAPHSGKTLLEMMPLPGAEDLFLIPIPTITTSAFTFVSQVPADIDRTHAHPLAISLHFTAQPSPNYSAELTLSCAGVTAKSMLTFKVEEVKPLYMGLIAGGIGMTSNNLLVTAAYETHLSAHLQGVMEELRVLKARLLEAEAAFDRAQEESRAATAAASESRVAVYSISRERQMDLEAMGITHDNLQEMPSDLRTFFMVDPQNINSLEVAQAALEAGQTYARDHLSARNEDTLMKFQNAFYPRLVQLR